MVKWPLSQILKGGEGPRNRVSLPLITGQSGPGPQPRVPQRAVGRTSWGVGSRPGPQRVQERWMIGTEAGGQVRSGAGCPLPPSCP